VSDAEAGAGTVPGGHGGWQLVQIADLLARGKRLGDRALRILSDVDADLPDDASSTLSAGETAELAALVLDIVQLGERLQVLAEALPREETAVGYAEVAAAAAADLAHGIIDVERARLAARVLDPHTGWRALAEGLTQTDSHTAWEAATIGDVLGSFRGVSPAAVHAVAADASLSADAELASCDPLAVVRLAASLEQHAASLLD
jgi:hypothetical protein